MASEALRLNTTKNMTDLISQHIKKFMQQEQVSLGLSGKVRAVTQIFQV